MAGLVLVESAGYQTHLGFQSEGQGNKQQGSKNMAHADLLWFVGLLEGEGCLGAWLSTRRGNHGYKLVIQASLVNTDPALIKEAALISQNNGIEPVVKWRQPTNHHWLIKGEVLWLGQQKVLALCNLVKPYLRGNKQIIVENLIRYLEFRGKRINHYEPQNLELLSGILNNSDKQQERFKEIVKRGGRLYASTQ